MKKVEVSKPGPRPGSPKPLLPATDLVGRMDDIISDAVRQSHPAVLKTIGVSVYGDIQSGWPTLSTKTTNREVVCYSDGSVGAKYSMLKELCTPGEIVNLSKKYGVENLCVSFSITGNITRTAAGVFTVLFEIKYILADGSAKYATFVPYIRREDGTYDIDSVLKPEAITEKFGVGFDHYVDPFVKFFKIFFYVLHPLVFPTITDVPCSKKEGYTLKPQIFDASGKAVDFSSATLIVFQSSDYMSREEHNAMLKKREEEKAKSMVAGITKKGQ